MGLVETGRLVGVCRYRLVDGPGVVPPVRSAARKASLLRAACVALGAGSIDLDSWGDDDEALAAYRSLGFELVVCEPGWQLRLDAGPLGPH